MSKFFVMLPTVSLAAHTLCACSSAESPDTGYPWSEHTVSSASAVDLKDCVAAHVAARGGDRNAVQKLDCSVATPNPCGVAEDLSSVTALRNLRELDLSGRCVVDLKAIGTLQELQSLTLAQTSVTDIRPLGSLTQLRSLDLSQNFIKPTWKFKTHEPFSRWKKLEHLNLDATGLEQILPLDALTALRTLSLRSNTLWSVRPLIALENLRTLHIDHNSTIEDLSPLAGLERLEELTFDGNLVSSLEPLRALNASTGRGRLRRVSLVRNCVASCDALTGIEHDCSDQSTDCGSMVATAPAYTLAVPVQLVERFAPADLPVWTAAQLRSGFELISSLPINWTSARSGCNDRSDEAIRGLQAAGYPGLTAVLAYGNLRPLTTNDPAGFLAFDWHIAPTARVALASGGTAYFVLDPALDPTGPLPLRQWYQRLIDSAGASLNFACVDYYGPPEVPDPAAVCNQNMNIALDAQGNLKVDPLSRLRGVICHDYHCQET